MLCRVLLAAALLLLAPLVSVMAQPAGPVPLSPGAAPRVIEPEPLSPLPSPAEPTSPGPAANTPEAAPSAAVPALPPAVERVFCDQTVTVQLADRDAVLEPYRPFVGIWSDASWTPQVCAALIVQSVTADGKATITYVFGPMASNAKTPGGVMRGTGVIRDGELRFQNSDGSQFAFRPVYSDLDGRLTTAKGQSFAAMFKKTQ